MRLGRESFTPQHRFLSDDEAFDVAVQFRREHPRQLRLISMILGWGDLRHDAAVRGWTFVAGGENAPEKKFVKVAAGAAWR